MVTETTRVFHTSPLKGAIYDCGGELTGAYAKEVVLTKGYKYLYNAWLM